MRGGKGSGMEKAEKDWGQVNTSGNRWEKGSEKQDEQKWEM